MASISQLLQHEDARIEQEDMSGHQHERPTARQRDQSLRLAHVVHSGFSHSTCLPASSASRATWWCKAVGPADNDRFDIATIEKLAIVRDALDGGIESSPQRASSDPDRRRRDDESSQLREHANVVRTPMATPDDANAEIAHLVGFAVAPRLSLANRACPELRRRASSPPLTARGRSRRTTGVTIRKP